AATASARASYANTAAIAASIFRIDPGNSFAIVIPARDVRLRAFNTCRRNNVDPSCVNRLAATASRNRSNARTITDDLFVHHSTGCACVARTLNRPPPSTDPRNPANAADPRKTPPHQTDRTRQQQQRPWRPDPPATQQPRPPGVQHKPATRGARPQPGTPPTPSHHH